DDAGSALAGGFYLAEIDDRNIVGVGRDAVGEFARRSQPGEIADPFAELAGRKRILIEAEGRFVGEVVDWHDSLPCSAVVPSLPACAKAWSLHWSGCGTAPLTDGLRDPRRRGAEESSRQAPYGSAACISGFANSKLPSSRSAAVSRPVCTNICMPSETKALIRALSMMW